MKNKNTYLDFVKHKKSGNSHFNIFQQNIFYFLNKPAINKTNDAPTTDVTNEPISPSPEPIPRSPKIQPPTAPPTIPRIMLTSRPNPPPFIRFPAIQPANAPIIIKYKKFIRLRFK